MSTKTTIKRIALVAVAAVGFGMLTGVAANAVGTTVPSIGAVGGTNGLPGASSTASGIVGAYIGDTVTAGTTDHYYTVTSTGVGTLSIGSTGANAGTLNGYSINSPTSVLWYAGSAAGTATFDTNNVLTFASTSSVAGTQVITVKGDVTAAITETITWGGAAVFSAGYSTAWLYKSAASQTAAAAADDAVTVDKATANAGIIVVNLQNSTPAAYTNGIVSASVSGSGLVLANNDPTFAVSGNAKVSSTTVKQALNYIHISGDNTAGTGTITISVTDATSGVTTVLGTKTVTFTGASVTAKAVGNLKVLKAGGTTYTGAGTATDATTVATTPALSAFTVDANGNPTNGSHASVKIVSSDTTVLTAGTCQAATGTDAVVGEYNCVVTGAGLAASGKSATITFEASTDSGATYSVVAAPVTFTIGGAIASEVISMDAASYAPLSPIVLTVSGKDSAGNAAYDQDAPVGGFIASAVASTQLGGVALSGTGGLLNGTAVKMIGGVATYKGVYAPSVEGDFTVSGTDNASGLAEAATSGKATVAGGAGSAAVDAANAATDAANYAADAADAATTAAQEATAAAQAAQDSADAATAAVVALGLRVNVLMASVRAQLTSLSNLLVRIIKKTHA